MSDENHFIELKLRINTVGSVSHEEYVVTEENILKDTDVNILNLKIKQTRINSALLKIKKNLEKNQINTDTEFFRYFSELYDLDSEPSNSICEEPQYCNFKKTLKKNPCSDCDEICSLTLEMILHPTNPVSQSDIYEELMVHHHPSSRIIVENGTKRNRTTKEAAEELASHYMYIHKKKRQ